MLCNGVAVPVATPSNARATAGPYRFATSLAACSTPSCHTQSPETVTARNFLPGYDRSFHIVSLSDRTGAYTPFAERGQG
jgi:hypothetical protein